jgi:hypothetical protein
VCRKQPNNARVCCRSCLVRHEKRAAEPTEAQLEAEPEWVCTRCYQFSKDFAARMKAAKDAKKRAATSDAARGGAAAGAPPPPPPSSRLPAPTPQPPAAHTVQKPSGAAGALAAAAKPGPSAGGGQAAAVPGTRELTAHRMRELKTITSALQSADAELSITIAFSSPLCGDIRIRSVLGEPSGMTAVTAATQVVALLDVQSAVFRDVDERISFLRSLHRVAEATDLAKEEAVEARRVAELEASLAAQKIVLCHHHSTCDQGERISHFPLSTHRSADKPHQLQRGCPKSCGVEPEADSGGGSSGSARWPCCALGRRPRHRPRCDDVPPSTDERDGSASCAVRLERRCVERTCRPPPGCGGRRRGGGRGGRAW